MEVKLISTLKISLSMFLFLLSLASSTAATVEEEEGRVYIVDRTGERWDITMAVSIGYDPDRFEFGIGRDAFKTLDDRHWTTNPESSDPAMRVIGVARRGEAHAYSVGKLRYHETANTRVGSQAIVVGY